MVSMRWIIIAAATGFAACTNQTLPDSGFVRTPWHAHDHQEHITASSCPDGEKRSEPLPIQLTATPVSLGDHLEPAIDLPNAEFVGGWHLTSDDPNFGGLSGLEMLPTGDLLAVSDEGAFVWIDMNDGAPVGARLAYMRGADGNLLSGKENMDAEGIALVFGQAFVSFERNHRILAFDLETCGSAARGITVAELGHRANGMSRDYRENGGAEALGYAPARDSLILGIETYDQGQISAELDASGQAVVTLRRHLDRDFAIVGMDGSGHSEFSLYRKYDPLRGNSVIVTGNGTGLEFLDFETPRIFLDPSVTVDNFEGIAHDDTIAEGTRIWIISDNNFSDRQRTLLMAFDLK